MFRARAAANVSRAARRAYSTPPGVTVTPIPKGSPGNEFIAQRQAVREHAKGTTALWKNVSFYVCIPAIIAGSWWTWKLEKEHEHHLDHVREENGGHLPPIPAYEYINIRLKPFPWGMQSLFFNPEVNTPAGDAE